MTYSQTKQIEKKNPTKYYKSIQGINHITEKGKAMRITTDSLSATMDARRHWKHIFKVLKEKPVKLEFCSAKFFSKMK
jgi:phosphoribosylaminoimidazole (AIR) synthetase